MSCRVFVPSFTVPNLLTFNNNNCQQISILQFCGFQGKIPFSTVRFVLLFFLQQMFFKFCLPTDITYIETYEIR